MFSDESRSDVRLEASREVSHENVISIRKGEVPAAEQTPPAAPQEAPSGSERASIPVAIDSAARIGQSVARRRFQRGSVYQNKARTVWLGMYSEYVLDSNGVEKRVRRQVMLGPIRKPVGTVMTKREAQRLLQPYVDHVNSSLSAPAREQERHI